MTKVEIFNLALNALKEPSVQAVDEGTHQANTLEIWWKPVVDQILRGRHYHFARGYSTLAEHADDPPAGWAYRYALPTDLLRVKRTYLDITSLANDQMTVAADGIKLPYDLTPSDDDSEMTLLSNYPDLLLEYTKTTADPSPLLWPNDFCEAVGWGLAVKACAPLTGRSDLINYCTMNYAAALSRAATHDYNSVHPDHSIRDAGSVRARARG